jgi:hypothetical protein
MFVAKLMGIIDFFQEFLRMFIQENSKIPKFQILSMRSYEELQYAQNDRGKNESHQHFLKRTSHVFAQINIYSLYQPYRHLSAMTIKWRAVGHTQMTIT